MEGHVRESLEDITEFGREARENEKFVNQPYLRSLEVDIVNLLKGHEQQSQCIIEYLNAEDLSRFGDDNLDQINAT